MLWYLIIPPFIVVISFGALLWLLSRRAGDEDVSRNLSLAKAETLSESRSRSLSRKAFYLKVIEKTASKFKTTSLRVHNFFQNGLERIRKRRCEIDAIRKHIVEKPPESEDVPVGSDVVSGQRQSRFPGKNRNVRDADVPAEEDEQSGHRWFRKSDVQARPEGGIPGTNHGVTSDSGDQERVRSVSRPILRREVVRPEPRVHADKDPREVELLSRIVENPRDTAAYEELGDWYFSAKNMEDAKECYRQALKLHPTNRAVKLKIRRLEKVFERRSE